MSQPRWELYTLTSQEPHARSWLTIQANLGLAPTTIDAYGRALQDYLGYCQRCGATAEQATREQIALYVSDLALRPNRRAVSTNETEAGPGLANATLQQRLTAV